MKNQVLSLLCGISFLVSSPVLGMDGEKSANKAPIAQHKGVQAEEEKPSESTVAVQTVFSPENLISDITIGILTKLQPSDCCAFWNVSQSWRKFLSFYREDVSLIPQIVEGGSYPFMNAIVNQTPDLSFHERKISLHCFSPQTDHMLELCTFTTPTLAKLTFPMEFEVGAPPCCLSDLSPIGFSYFRFFGTPREFSLQGVPEGWGGDCYNKGKTLFSVACSDLDIDLSSSLHEQKLTLTFLGELRGPSGYGEEPPLLKCALSNPSYAQTEIAQTKKANVERACLENRVKFLWKTKQALEYIQERTEKPMNVIKEILGMKPETKEEAFAKLRSEVIRLTDAAMSTEDIARQLDLPEETIEAIRNSQPGNQ